MFWWSPFLVVLPGIFYFLSSICLRWCHRRRRLKGLKNRLNQGKSSRGGSRNENGLDSGNYNDETRDGSGDGSIKAFIVAVDDSRSGNHNPLIIPLNGEKGKRHYLPFSLPNFANADTLFNKLGTKIIERSEPLLKTTTESTMERTTSLLFIRSGGAHFDNEQPVAVYKYDAAMHSAAGQYNIILQDAARLPNTDRLVIGVLVPHEIYMRLAEMEREYDAVSDEFGSPEEYKSNAEDHAGAHESKGESIIATESTSNTFDSEAFEDAQDDVTFSSQQKSEVYNANGHDRFRIQDIHFWAVPSGWTPLNDTRAYLRPYFHDDEASVCDSFLFEAAVLCASGGVLVEIHSPTTYGYAVLTGFASAFVLLLITLLTPDPLRTSSPGLVDEHEGGAAKQTKVRPSESTVVSSLDGHRAVSPKRKSLFQRCEKNVAPYFDVFAKILVTVFSIALLWTFALGSYDDNRANSFPMDSNRIIVRPNGCQVVIKRGDGYCRSSTCLTSIDLWEPRFNTLTPPTMYLKQTFDSLSDTVTFDVLRRDGKNWTEDDAPVSLHTFMAHSSSQNSSTNVESEYTENPRVRCRIDIGVPENHYASVLPPIVVEGNEMQPVSAQISAVHLSNLTIKSLQGSVDLAVFQSRADTLAISADGLAHMKLEQVEVLKSVTISAKTLTGFAYLKPRSLDGMLYIDLDEVTLAGDLAFCSRAAYSNVSASSDVLLSPNPSWIANGVTALTSRLYLRNVESGSFTVDVSEGQCSQNPVIRRGTNLTIEGAYLALDNTNLQRIVTNLKRADIVDLRLQGDGTAPGTWALAPSQAWLSFSSSFLYAFSFSLLTPSIHVDTINLRPDFCTDPRSTWLPDELSLIAENAKLINQLKAKSETSSRLLSMIFMARPSSNSDSEFGQSIYTVSAETIARRRSLNEGITFLLILSIVISVGLTIFIFWLCFVVLMEVYTKAKMKTAWQIALEHLNNRFIEDPVVAVRLAEIACKISCDISLTTYLQLEMHRSLNRFKNASETNGSATDHGDENKIALSIQITKSCMSKSGRRSLLMDAIDTLYMARESILCAAIQLFPSAPSLAVTWLYQRARQSEIYLAQPMDYLLDTFAEWLMFVALATISLDIVAFTISKLAFYPKNRNCIIKAMEPLMWAGSIIHSALRSSCYLNSALITSNLCVWVILAIALKPERAIPAATAAIAMIGHVSNLYKRLETFLTMFEELAEKKLEHIRLQMRKLEIGPMLEKCLPKFVPESDADAITLAKLAKTADKLKQKLAHPNMLKPLLNLCEHLQRMQMSKENGLALTFEDYMVEGHGYSARGFRTMLSDIQTLRNFTRIYELDRRNISDLETQNPDFFEEFCQEKSREAQSNLLKNVVVCGMKQVGFEDYQAGQLSYKPEFSHLQLKVEDSEIRLKAEKESTKNITDMMFIFGRKRKFRVKEAETTFDVNLSPPQKWECTCGNTNCEHISMCKCLCMKVDHKFASLRNMLERAINFYSSYRSSSIYAPPSHEIWKIWENSAHISVSLAFLLPRIEGDSENDTTKDLGRLCAQGILTLIKGSCINEEHLWTILRYLCGLHGKEHSFQWLVLCDALRNYTSVSSKYGAEEVYVMVKQLENLKSAKPKFKRYIHDCGRKAFDIEIASIREMNHLKESEKLRLAKLLSLNKISLNKLNACQIEAMHQVQKGALQKIRRICKSHFRRQKEALRKSGTSLNTTISLQYILRVFARSGILLNATELNILMGIFLHKRASGRQQMNLKQIHEMMKEEHTISQTVKFKPFATAINSIDQAVENFVNATKFKDNIGQLKNTADQILEKYGLSRYKLAMVVLGSAVLLLLLFVLIFVSQNVFASQSLAAGIISSVLCSGTTIGVNHTVKQNTTSKSERDKILNDIQSAQSEALEGDDKLLQQLDTTTIQVVSSLKDTPPPVVFNPKMNETDEKPTSEILQAEEDLDSVPSSGVNYLKALEEEMQQNETELAKARELASAYLDQLNSRKNAYKKLLTKSRLNTSEHIRFKKEAEENIEALKREKRQLEQICENGIEKDSKHQISIMLPQEKANNPGFVLNVTSCRVEEILDQELREKLQKGDKLVMYAGKHVYSHGKYQEALKVAADLAKSPERKTTFPAIFRRDGYLFLLECQPDGKKTLDELLRSQGIECRANEKSKDIVVASINHAQLKGDNTDQISIHDKLVEVFDEETKYSSLQKVFSGNGPIKLRFVKNVALEEMDAAMSIIAKPLSGAGLRRGFTKTFLRKLKSKLVSSREKALNLRKKHYEQSMEEASKIMKKLEKVNTQWCLKFVEECLGHDQAQVTRHADEIQELKDRLDISQRRVDMWQHLAKNMSNDPSVCEYYFDMGQSFDNSVFSEGNDWNWDRFTSDDERQEVMLDGRALQPVKGVLSVHTDGEFGLRIRFRSPEKLAEIAGLQKEQEAGIRRLEQDIENLKKGKGIQAPSVTRKESELESLKKSLDRIVKTSKKPSVSLSHLKSKLSGILGSSPRYAEECPSSLGKTPVDPQFEAAVYSKLGDIRSLLRQLRPPSDEFENLFDRCLYWKVTMAGLQGKTSDLSRLARQCEEGIKELKTIMDGDAFYELRTARSASLASTGEKSMSFVHRCIFNDANDTVASLNRMYDKLPDNIREVNFVGEKFKHLQSTYENVRSEIGDSEGVFWEGKAARLCKKTVKQGDIDNIVAEIVKYLSDLAVKLDPLRNAIDTVDNDLQMSMLEASIKSSAQLVLAKYDETGWTSEKWADEKSGQPIVLQLCSAIRDSKRARDRLLETHSTVLKTKDWKPKSRSDIEMGSSAAQDVRESFDYLNDAIDKHQTSLNKSNMRNFTKLEVDMLEEAHAIREKLYHDYDTIKGVTGAGPLAINRESLKELYENMAKTTTYSKGVAPKYFDTMDDPDGILQAKEGSSARDDFTVNIERKYSTQSGSQKIGLYNDKGELVPISVKCEVCATSVVALSLLLYPSKFGKTETTRQARKGEAKMSNSSHLRSTPFIFVCDQKSRNITRKDLYADQTWETAPKKWINTLARWWTQKTRKDLESVWENVWLRTVDPGKKHSASSLKYRMDAWYALKRGFPRHESQKSYPELYAAFSRANGGDMLDPESARKVFYEDLREEQNVWTFTEGRGEERVRVAVKLLARVAKRIRKVYNMYVVDYLKLLSNTEKTVYMVYEFLFDMVGDLIEEEVSDREVFSSSQNAGQLRGSLPSILVSGEDA